MKKMKAVLFGLLLTVVSISANAYPANFVGTWVNMNPHTRGIVRVTVDSSLMVHLYGACTPTPCDYGATPLYTYGKSVSDLNHRSATSHYTFSFKMVEVAGYLTNWRRLTLAHFNRFTDASGRQNYVMQENFRKITAAEEAQPFESHVGEPEN